MKLARLILYLALGFVVRSLYLFFFGSGGLVDYHRLESQKQQLEANLRDLQTINLRLIEEQQALGSDPERVTLQARELGYFREGELALRLEGHRPAGRYFAVGRLIQRAPAAERRDWIAKMLGLAIPVVLFALALVRERRRHAPARH